MASTVSQYQPTVNPWNPESLDSVSLSVGLQYSTVSVPSVNPLGLCLVALAWAAVYHSLSYINLTGYPCVLPCVLLYGSPCVAVWSIPCGFFPVVFPVWSSPVGLWVPLLWVLLGLAPVCPVCLLPVCLLWVLLLSVSCGFCWASCGLLRDRCSARPIHPPAGRWLQVHHYTDRVPATGQRKGQGPGSAKDTDRPPVPPRPARPPITAPTSPDQPVRLPTYQPARETRPEALLWLPRGS